MPNVQDIELTTTAPAVTDAADKAEGGCCGHCTCGAGE